MLSARLAHGPSCRLGRVTSTDSLPIIALTRAAKRLGVPASWLRREAEVGSIPSLRAGRQILINVSAVADILAERAAKNCQETGGLEMTPAVPPPQESKRASAAESAG